LIFENKIHGALNRRMFAGQPNLRGIRHARGDIGGGRIDHRVVIRKGNVAEKLLVVVRSNAPQRIAVLHAEQPLESRGVWRLPCVWGRDTSPRWSAISTRGVVDVRIKITFRNSKAHPPGSASLFFTCQSPGRALAESIQSAAFTRDGMIRRQAGFFQGDHGDAGIQTGETHGCIRIVSPSSISKRENSFDFPPGQRIVRAGHRAWKIELNHRRIDGPRRLIDESQRSIAWQRFGLSDESFEMPGNSRRAPANEV